jgi:hypothetical protein
VGVLTVLIGAEAFIKLVRQSVVLTAALELAGLLVIPSTGLLEDFSLPNHFPVLVTVTATNLVVLSLRGVTLRR